MNANTNNPKRIITIGDVILDILPTPFPISKEKVLMDGETFVDSVTFQRGGCGGNFVCVLKSIFPDAQVEFISRVGNDANGEFLVQEMTKYGVIPHFKKAPNISTQVTIAVSFMDGERHFITSLGGLEEFATEDVDLEILDNIDHLAFRGPWFAEKLLKNIHTILEPIAAKGIPISMDLGFDPYWNRDDKDNPSIMQKIQERKDAVFRVLPNVTYLFGNELEFLHLTQATDLTNAIYQLFDLGVKNIVMHRGSKGAVVYEPKNTPTKNLKEIHETPIPAAKVEILNPVGSGDTFDSILIAQLTEGKTLTAAAALASAGAAYSLQSSAGTKITLDKVEEFIKSYPNLQKLL